jgi:hypothetical protein
MVTVSVDGERLAPAVIRPGENAFEISFPLPAGGKNEWNVGIEANRTFRPANDPRELSLAFGSIEVR